MMFAIANHEFARADTPNRVALYIGGDAVETLISGREGIALECAALEVGQSREFGYIIGHGRETDAPIVVTRVSGSGGA